MFEETKMTEKLYYKDAYIKTFRACVISADERNGKFDVVLDRSAFFPNQGGQSADSGYIGTSRVLDVYEDAGTLHHVCDTPVSVGAELDCSLDFDQRFEKMQSHTAEHLLCGIMHKLYGCENVGFHLGEDEVVFDVNTVLTSEQMDEVLVTANRAVYENRKVSARFPSSSELQAMAYRSKSDISGEVRIVEIEGYDSCACCAPHVSYTGEIGVISILNFEKHRGGTRIYMLAGVRAERDYTKRRAVAQRISALTSEPQATIDVAVEKLINDAENLRQSLKQAKETEARLRAELMPKADKNAVVLLADFKIPELISFSNEASSKVGGVLVALCGKDGDFKYVISSKETDVRALAKDINAALLGRGGGRPEMIQGSFASTLKDIKRYFEV